MSKLSELQESVKTALRAGEKERVIALRMVVCELQNASKAARADLDEIAELAVLRRELKRRQESIEAFRAGGREDLAAHEEFAARIIEELLPRQMDEAQLAELVDRVIADTGATSARDMGKVMSAVMAEGGILVEGKLASRLVKERLSA
ncbi:MAG: GatB/YqeY domain-containing protein [Thermoleophilia bacterium]|nr:GatB/YqeY domain-containing protein [Thermoleophilia bacterium]